MSDIVGLGVGLQAAGAMGNQIGNIFSGMNPQQPAQPVQQTQPVDDMAAFKAKVEKLTVMKEAGIISEEEFTKMKAKLLSEIL